VPLTSENGFIHQDHLKGQRVFPFPASEGQVSEVPHFSTFMVYDTLIVIFVETLIQDFGLYKSVLKQISFLMLLSDMAYKVCEDKFLVSRHMPLIPIPNQDSKTSLLQWRIFFSVFHKSWHNLDNFLHRNVIIKSSN
jgi:hypothetical protein